MPLTLRVSAQLPPSWQHARCACVPLPAHVTSRPDLLLPCWLPTHFEVSIHFLPTRRFSTEKWANFEAMKSIDDVMTHLLQLFDLHAQGVGVRVLACEGGHLLQFALLDRQRHLLLLLLQRLSQLRLQLLPLLVQLFRVLLGLENRRRFTMQVLQTTCNS